MTCPMCEAEFDVVRDGKLLARLGAARADVGPGGDVSLRDFDLQMPPTRRIRGRRAVWRVAKGELLVTARYEPRDDGLVTRGRGLRIALPGSPGG